MASGAEAHRLAAQLADVGRRLASVSAALEGEAGGKGGRGPNRPAKGYGKGNGPRNFGDFVPARGGNTVGSHLQRVAGPGGQGSGKSRRRAPAGSQPFQGPMWHCLGCGASSNFATRALDGSGCRTCGAAAHKAAFKKADEWWTEVHGHAYQRTPPGATTTGGKPGGAAAQVQATTTPTPPASPSADGAEAQADSKPTEQKLRQELKATQDMLAAAKRLGDGDAWVEQLSTRVEALKKDISSCRPVEAQLRGAFAKQEAAMAEKNRLQAAVAEYKAKLLTLEKQLGEAVETAAQATKELQQLQSQLEFADSAPTQPMAPEGQLAGLLALLASVPAELRPNAEPLVQHFVKQGTAVQEGKAGAKRPCAADDAPGAKAHCTDPLADEPMLGDTQDGAAAQLAALQQQAQEQLQLQAQQLLAQQQAAAAAIAAAGAAAAQATSQPTAATATAPA